MNDSFGSITGPARGLSESPRYGHCANLPQTVDGTESFSEARGELVGSI